MARPPRPHYGATSTGGGRELDGSLDYMPHELASLVELQRGLARDEHGLPIPADAEEPGQTLLELSALVAHILGVYQDHYAADAYLGTTESEVALRRHGRRLAYEADPGLAATGFLALWAGRGLVGTVPRGFAVGSPAIGEAKPQHYETLRDVAVDVLRNELVLKNRTKVGAIAMGDRHVDVQGTGHGLQPGDVALLVGPGKPRGLRIDLVQEDTPRSGMTRVTFETTLQVSSSLAKDPTITDLDHQRWRLLVDPREVMRPFAHDADPTRWPPAKVRSAGDGIDSDPAAGQVKLGWTVQKTSGAADDDTALANDVFLSRAVETDLEGDWVLRVEPGADGTPQWVEAQIPTQAALVRCESMAIGVPMAVDETRTGTVTHEQMRVYSQPVSAGMPVMVSTEAAQDVDLYLRMGAAPTTSTYDQRGYTGSGNESLVIVPEQDGTLYIGVHGFYNGTTSFTLRWNTTRILPSHQIMESALTGDVTTLRLLNITDFHSSGTSVPRSQVHLGWSFLGGWAKALELVYEVPDFTPLGSTLLVQGNHGSLLPGDLLCVATENSGSEVREVSKVEVGPSGIESTIYTTRVAGTASATRYEAILCGNVVPISHGRTVDEVLGDSDGVTQWQRFTLAQSPLTWLPGPTGPEPALEIRVADIAWTRVDDFYDSGPDDRHYRVERDPEGGNVVVFGDGVRGAIPSSGRRHIRATYRVGLGVEGNKEAGQIDKIKRAHPLVERAWNPMSVQFGADPARAEDVRSQATRRIRTFERAVSVPDHADLALLYPGVARSAARWSDERGVELAVAASDGTDLCTNDGLRRWLDVRRDTSIPLVLVHTEAVPVRLWVQVQPDPAHLVERVRIAVREALMGTHLDAPGMFSFAGRRLGQPVFVSEVYARLEAVEGVISVRILQLSKAGSVLPDPVADVVHAGHWQWLQLSSSNLTLDLGT